jgi:hypothetical protein
MPLEGHPSDCDCGCCGTPEETPIQEKPECMCPSCGRQSIAAGNMSCADMKCPHCGATMKPAV